MAGDRMKQKPKTAISTERLEQLVADSLLLEKYAHVIEDLAVTTCLTRAGVVCHVDADKTETDVDDFYVHIESEGRSIEQVGPRKDWRATLDTALTIWSEKPVDIDPL